MDRERLRKVLNKFSKQQLHPALSFWDRVRKPPAGLNKAQCVSFVLDEDVNGVVSGHDINRLELYWATTHMSTLRWTAYTMTPITGPHTVSLLQYQSTFSNHLELLLTHEMYSCCHDSVNWVLIRVHQSSRDYTCYVVHCPRSNSVFLAGVKKKQHWEAILLCLCDTLGWGSWADGKLTGRDLPSLIAMATQDRHSQVHRPHTNNPLLLLHSNADTLPLSSDEEAEAAFGTGPLPKLESFTILMEHNGGHRTCCKLKGTHVLEGVRTAVARGHTTLPVTDTLKRLPHMAHNTVTITADPT